jgi:Ca2+-binding RTX toxin-like protein
MKSFSFIETLENRRMFSVSHPTIKVSAPKPAPIAVVPAKVGIINGELTLTGSSGNDIILVLARPQVVHFWDPNGSYVQESEVVRLTVNGMQLDYSTSSSNFSGIQITGGGGNDAISTDVVTGGLVQMPVTIITSTGGKSTVGVTSTDYTNTFLAGADMFTGHDALVNGFEFVQCGNYTCIVHAGPGGATIIGGSGNNSLLVGGDGNDTIIAGSGNNCLIYGKGGDDYLVAGTGKNSFIYGGTGNNAVVIPAQYFLNAGLLHIDGGQGGYNTLYSPTDSLPNSYVSIVNISNFQTYDPMAPGKG